MEYSKTFQFGKVDYNGTGSKRNLVELEISLKVEGKKRIFSAVGGVWNTIKTDYYTCGQCIDDIYIDFASQMQDPSLYKKIMVLWKKWHLNNMHAGCEHQEKLWNFDALIDKKAGKSQDNQACWTYWKGYKGTTYGKISAKGLLMKPCPVCGYEYGSAWKYQAIAKKDLFEICLLLDLDPQVMRQITK